MKGNTGVKVELDSLNRHLLLPHSNLCPIHDNLLRQGDVRVAIHEPRHGTIQQHPCMVLQYITLEHQLRKHLEPKLTDRSVQIHKNLGFQAKDYPNSILNDELVMTFEKEVFYRYGRALVYLSVEDCNTYNYRLVTYGIAIFNQEGTTFEVLCKFRKSSFILSPVLLQSVH